MSPVGHSVIKCTVAFHDCSLGLVDTLVRNCRMVMCPTVSLPASSADMEMSISSEPCFVLDYVIIFFYHRIQTWTQMCVFFQLKNLGFTLKGQFLSFQYPVKVHRAGQNNNS